MMEEWKGEKTDKRGEKGDGEGRETKDQVKEGGRKGGKSEKQNVGERIQDGEDV